MFSATERCGRSACSRSAGTSTTPARIASYGMPRAQLAAVDEQPARRVAAAARRARRRARPVPEPRARRSRGSRRAARRTRRPSTAPPTPRPSTASAARSPATTDALARGRALVGGRLRPRLGLRRPRDRASSSTICSSPPSEGTRVPTSLPSRRIVARSQIAITSRRRCVMKSAERSRSFCRRITSKTRSARSDGSAAVISSRIRSCGSRASARARSSMRSIGSGTSSACSAEIDVRGRARAAPAGPRRPRRR